MDSITHSLIGACMGHAIAGKKTGKKAMLAGALIHNFPDIDVLTHFFASDARGFLLHRGFTHSFLCIILITPLLVWLCKKVFSGMPLKSREWYFLVFSGLLTHLLTDALTVYGTGLLEPFSQARLSYDCLFIIDPLFTLPVFIGTFILLLRNKSVDNTNTGQFALLVALLYLSFVFFMKSKTDSIVKQNISDQQIHYKKFIATPTPFNSLLWYIVIKCDSSFLIGYYSHFDKTHNIEFEEFKQTPIPETKETIKKEIEYLKQFSQGYYLIQQKDSGYYFSDLRFGQIGGWSVPQSDFVYNFNLTTPTGNSETIQRGRMKTVTKEAFLTLWERIKGK